MLRSHLLTITGLCFAALAQQPAQQAEPKSAEPQAPSIKVQVNEVIVPVTVTDYRNRFISNLDKSDFKIYENGREQKIAYFSRERDQPVVVGLVLDLSSFSRVHWKNFQEAASELMWTLLADERAKKYSAFLVTYSTDAELAVNTTNDPSLIVEKIRKLRPGGGSAMYDAIRLAITKHKLIKGEPLEPRRVLIVVGSGNDSASKYTVDQTIELAQRNLVTIYAVSTTAYGFANEGDANLKRMAEETGGRVETPLQGVYDDVAGYISKPQDAGAYQIEVGTGGYAAAVASNMLKAIVNIAGEVTTQYILRYIPDTEDARKPYRVLKVEVLNLPPDVKVRARKGYYPLAP
jgi:VWFA-related protein